MTVRVHLSVCDQSQLAEGRLCVRENCRHSVPQLGWPTRACRGSTRERIKINCRQHLILPFKPAAAGEAGEGSQWAEWGDAHRQLQGAGGNSVWEGEALVKGWGKPQRVIGLFLVGVGDWEHCCHDQWRRTVFYFFLRVVWRKWRGWREAEHDGEETLVIGEELGKTWCFEAAEDELLCKLAAVLQWDRGKSCQQLMYVAHSKAWLCSSFCLSVQVVQSTAFLRLHSFEL